MARPVREAGVVAIFLEAMVRGGATTIFGDGSQTRDFVYVGDVADAFARALTRGSGVHNIGTGVETSVLQLWKLCAGLANYSRAPVFASPRAGELHRNALDARRAARNLAWQPRVMLEQGIEATARFFAVA